MGHSAKLRGSHPKNSPNGVLGLQAEEETLCEGLHVVHAVEVVLLLASG